MRTVEELKNSMVEAQRLCMRGAHDICPADKKALPLLLALKRYLAEYLEACPDDVAVLRFMYLTRCYLLDFSGALPYLEQVCQKSADRKDKKNLAALREIAAKMKCIKLEPDQITVLKDTLEKRLAKEACDHTLRHTRQWLAENISQKSKHAAIIKGLQNSGGYCDCEIAANVTEL